MSVENNISLKIKKDMYKFFQIGNENKIKFSCCLTNQTVQVEELLQTTHLQKRMTVVDYQSPPWA